MPRHQRFINNCNMSLEFSKFRIRGDGFELLRNRFSYKTLEVNSIKEIIMKYDHLSKRWVLSLVVGFIIWFLTIMLGAYYMLNVSVDGFLNAETIRATGIFPFVVMFLLFVGGMFIRVSLVKTLVLVISFEKINCYLPIEKKDVDKKKISQLYDFLKKGKFEVVIINQKNIRKWINGLPLLST